MITKSDLQKVSANVLKRLNDIQALPNSGTVAGQAVASMFWEELGLDIQGPVNDIDVFVNDSMPVSERGNPVQRKYAHVQKTTSTGEKAEDNQSYEHVKFIALRSQVRILSSYNDQMINYTCVADESEQPLYSSMVVAHSLRLSQNIVDGFDINAVSVGINLKTGEAVCSQGFLDFCEHRQLQAQTCNTPAHTLIRLAKKWHGQEITGRVLCDYQSERDMLETAIVCQTNNQPTAHYRGEHPTEAIVTFGKKYKELTEQYQQHLPQLVQARMYLPFNSRIVLSALDVPHKEDTLSLSLMEAKNAISNHMSRAVFFRYFPKVYALMHSHDTQAQHKKQHLLHVLSKDEQEDQFLGNEQWYKNLCQQLNENATSTTSIPMVSLTKALDLEPVVHNQTNMSEHDSVVMFYNQYRNNAQDRPVVIDQYNANPELMKFLMTSLQKNADMVYDWAQNPLSILSAIWGKAHMVRNMHDMLCKSDKNIIFVNHNTEAPVFFQNVARDYYKAFIDCLKHADPEFVLNSKKILLHNMLTNTHSYHDKQKNTRFNLYAGHVHKILNVFPIEDREELYQSIYQSCNQSLKNDNVETTTTFKGMYWKVARVLSGLSVGDLSFDQTMPYQEVLHILRNVCHNDSFGGRVAWQQSEKDLKEATSDKYMDGSIKDLLDKVTDEELSKGCALVVRLAHSVSHDAVLQRLQEVSDRSLAQTIAQNMLDKVSLDYTSTNEEHGETKYEPSPRLRQGEKEEIEKILLLLHTPIASVNKNHRKKM